MNSEPKALPAPETYWRIRMREGEYSIDHSEEAWNRNEVGIWYGAWTTEDFLRAETTADPASHLTNLKPQKALGWAVKPSYASAARRFFRIPNGQWVIVYFNSHLHFARISGDVRSTEKHPLNTGEIFKYRKITAKKSFNLAHLPDVYRLIPSAGRGNIHEYHGYWELVRLLANSRNEQQVLAQLKSLPLNEALDLLGDTGWESFCMGYLILEDDFVPTGLLLGRSLKDHDIVGRNRRSGGRVFAQCKKNPYPVTVADGFLESCEDLGSDDRAYYFAYGGCTGAVPSNVKVVSRKEVEAWVETKRGKSYFEMFFN
jgi:hypothetical protein